MHSSIEYAYTPNNNGVKMECRYKGYAFAPLLKPTDFYSVALFGTYVSDHEECKSIESK